MNGWAERKTVAPNLSPGIVKQKLKTMSEQEEAGAPQDDKLATGRTVKWAVEPRPGPANGTTHRDAAMQTSRLSETPGAPLGNRERGALLAVELPGFRDPLEKFGVGAWLRAVSEDGPDRYGQGLSMQTGNVWQAFQQRLKGSSELEVVRLLGALLRFAKTERSAGASLLFSAYVPLSLEHDAFGEYIGFETLGRLKHPRQSIVLVRRTLRRWCQWIESRAHWNAHQSMRHSTGHQMETEKILILLWPLAQRHKWNTVELLNVLCLVSHRPARWFCKSQEDLISKVRAVGLNLNEACDAAENPPTGCSVALRYSQFWLSSTYNRAPVCL